MNTRRSFSMSCSLLIACLLLPALALADITYSLTSSWPEKLPWSMKFPTGVAVGGDGTVYVADRNNNRIVTTSIMSDTLMVNVWGGNGGFADLSLPSGVAVGLPNGYGGDDVFIVDTANHRIVKASASSGMGAAMGSWGSKGSANGQFSFPNAVAVDSAGYVYVVDSGNNRIQKFDSNGVFQVKWGTAGSGNGQFSNPRALAIDSGNNIYVVDTGNKRVQKFDSTGTFLLAFGSAGTGDGKFARPAGIAVDTSGTVYVSDAENNQVQTFGSNGTFSSRWGTTGSADGQIRYPTGLAVDGNGQLYLADSGNWRVQVFSGLGSAIETWSNWGTADGTFAFPGGAAVAGGNLYVADTFNSRIQRFSSSGTFSTKWGDFGSSAGAFLWPNGVALDSGGNVYVADTVNNRIQKFDQNGTFVKQWGSAGTGNGQFDYPGGVATDSVNNVYVSDSGNNRIQKFAQDGTFAAAWGSSGGGAGQLSYPMGITTDTNGDLLVADSGNHRVQKFSTSGTFLGQQGSFGTANGQFIFPCAVAVDSQGRIAVADTGNDRIQRFSANGTFIDTFGSTGPDTSSVFPVINFRQPRGIAVDPIDDSLYVVDSGNHRIQKFNLSGVQLDAPRTGEHWQRGTTQKIKMSVAGDSGMAFIYFLKGGVPLTLTPTFLLLNPGSNLYNWDIPITQALGSDYQVMVQLSQSGGGSTATSGYFSITGPQYLLTVAGASGIQGGSVTGTNGLSCQIAANGAATGYCTENVDPNVATTLTATPENGGSANWTGCTSVNGNTCTVTPAGATTVTVSFSVANYTVTTAPGANGTISCTPTSLTGGQDSACTITPATGYHVVDVKVGPTAGAQTSVGAQTHYTITGIQADTTISATFAPSSVKRVGATTDYFSTVADAYTTAANSDQILCRAMTFSGNLAFNRAVQVKLSGGYTDTAFTARTGVSKVAGKVSISSGKVSVMGSLAIY